MIVLVALAGGLGAALRYTVDALLPAGDVDAVPRGTVVVNVSGSFLAGLLGAALGAGALAPAAYVVGVAGFCGGYTTFSTASLDAVRLLQRGRVGAAAGYACGTLLTTTAAAAAGALVGAWVLG